MFIIDARVGPVMRIWAETTAVTLATRAINVAIQNTMTQSLDAPKLTNVIANEQGQLQAIQYNTGELNRISSATSLEIVDSLLEMGQEIFSVPLGVLSGIDFLAGWGPAIPVKVLPVGGVSTTPVSRFESAGINQTMHRIYLDIVVDMRVAIPLSSLVIPVSASVPLVEEVIVGTVPTWYFAPSGTAGGFVSTPSSSLGNAIEFNLSETGLVK